MKLASKLADSFRTSEFYLHHSGFGGWITVNFFDKRNKLPGMMTAIHEDVAESKYRDIRAGRNALYIELFVDDDATEDRFTCLAFEHHDLKHRRRIDLFIAPGADASHIHARLTANQDKVLFDGDVPLFSDSFEEPFILDAPRA